MLKFWHLQIVNSVKTNLETQTKENTQVSFPLSALLVPSTVSVPFVVYGFSQWAAFPLVQHSAVVKAGISFSAQFILELVPIFLVHSVGKPE